MKYCAHGGMLVNAQSPVPLQPWDHRPPTALSFLGCNRLHCAGCDSEVRQLPGVELAPDFALDGSELYECPSPGALPGVIPDPRARLYFCRCSRWLELVAHELDPEDSDPESDPVLPWRCAGHPEVGLPLTLDGVSLASEADVRDVVQRALGGSLPSQADPMFRDQPYLWVDRLYALLGHLPEAETCVTLLRERLDAPDPLARGVALHFFHRFPLTSGLEPIVARVEQDGSLLAEPLPVGLDHRCFTVRRLDVILAARAALPDGDPLQRRLEQLLQTLLPELAGKDGEIVSAQLAPAHGLALAHQAGHLTATSSGLWPHLLEGLVRARHPELVAIAGVAILQRGAVLPDDVAAWCDSMWHTGKPYAAVIRAALDEMSISSATKGT